MASVGNSEDEVELNIMPMLDIFSILILFLLTSFSTEPVNHSLTKGVDLAPSATLSSLDEIPAIIVSKTEILVNDRPVAAIVGNDVEATAVMQGAVYPVYLELKKMAEVSKRVQTTTTAPKKVNALTMEIDKGHSFKIIRRLMLAGQQAEFTSFKLMVMKTNS